MFRMLMTASLMMLTLCNTSWGQTYPSRSVRIVVGFGTGAPDTTARLVGQQLAAQTGQPFIVDNRPGAAGSIGADIVAKANPDGYTLLVASATLTNLPSIYKNLPFDVIKDFAAISQVARSEAYVLVVHPSLPVQNVKDLIALARRPDNKLSYGSNGTGTGGHLVTALFNARAKATMMHVPYKSAGASTTALMSGEVQVLFSTPPLVLPLIKAGKIKALAYDSNTRAPFLPDVPTVAEAGVSPTEMSTWHGIFATARTPAAVVARLEAEVRKAIALPDMRERIEKLGLIPVGSSSEEFRAIVAKEVKTAAEAARAAGIEPE